MILVFETTWDGTMHAPGNSATVQSLARAFPEQQVLMLGSAAHLEQVNRDPEVAALPNLRLAPIGLWPGARDHTQHVRASRAWHEFATFRAGLALVPKGESCLIFLISTTATATFAAAAAAHLSGRRCGVLVGWHGNLSEALSPRSRNPLARAFDIRAGLDHRWRLPVRFLVLEQIIKQTLAGVSIAAAARTDVLPLPILTREAKASSPATLGWPIRFGFVGWGSPAKGFDRFLDAARQVKARWGERAEFVHIGRANKPHDPAANAVLAYPLTDQPLPRDEFARRVDETHFITLPFQRGYYDFAASGGLIDAVTWTRPVVTSDVPLTRQFFDEYGDIGSLCADDSGFATAIEDILTAADPQRYAAQVANLAAARDSRLPVALASRFRALVQQGFPGLL